MGTGAILESVVGKSRGDGSMKVSNPSGFGTCDVKGLDGSPSVVNSDAEPVRASTGAST